MFRNRQSSQRPPEELFEKFKKSFPDVRSTTGTTEVSNTATASNLQEVPFNQPSGTARYHEDLDPTPRAPAEPFRFTPSLLDPNSSAFAAFANQPPGYYTPTPGAPNAGYNNHVNELPTPNMGISIETSLSMSNGMAMAPVTASDLSFAPQTIQPHQFHPYLGFAQPLQPQYVEPAFDRQESGPGSPMDLGGELEMQPMMQMYGNKYEHEHAPLSTEKFRYHVTLNAPTAMIKHPDEIPVTYLNKGQAYTISIADTVPPALGSNARYRTYVRISFHDEGQRAKPAQCWQLWKEGRGTNEAHQRGGRLQAVEFVENSANGEDEKKKGKVELESASFDGFAVTWSPSTAGQTDTLISVRFNFLSTDFSHSKGVKGIPVRLCAKTELLTSGSPRSQSEAPEICFCKVKLFRDHGAERKLANDVLHVKKTIEKLRQQLQQTEGTGLKLFGKKKHNNDDLLKGAKPGKALKHKRTWSMSSASSVVGGKTAEEEANEKLQTMQDMFTSTRPVSVLYLRGTDLDDPDLHPVQLSGETQDLTEEIWARRRSSVATTASSFVSPSPSSTSLSQQGEHYSPEKREWVERGYHPLQPNLGSSTSLEIPVKVKQVQNDTGMLSGWIEAIGIDPTYHPPEHNPPPACLCVYILPALPGSPTNNSTIYRAVYLSQRTQACFTAAVAAKCGLDPISVLRTTMVNAQGLTILVDDDVIQQMKEGQDMKVEVIEMEDASPPEWNTNGDVKHIEPRGFELKLIY